MDPNEEFEECQAWDLWNEVYRSIYTDDTVMPPPENNLKVSYYTEENVWNAQSSDD